MIGGHENSEGQKRIKRVDMDAIMVLDIFRHSEIVLSEKKAKAKLAGTPESVEGDPLKTFVERLAPKIEEIESAGDNATLTVNISPEEDLAVREALRIDYQLARFPNKKPHENSESFPIRVLYGGYVDAYKKAPEIAS